MTNDNDLSNDPRVKFDDPRFHIKMLEKEELGSELVHIFRGLNDICVADVKVPYGNWWSTDLHYALNFTTPSGVLITAKFPSIILENMSKGFDDIVSYHLSDKFHKYFSDIKLLPMNWENIYSLDF